MKLHRNIRVAAVSMLALFASCKDNEFLTENMTDRVSTETAYTNKAQLEGLSGSFYRYVQLIYNMNDGPHEAWILGLGTDVCFDPRDDNAKYNNWGLVNSVEGYSADWFNNQYTLIKNTNQYIESALKPGFPWATETEKNQALAEAYFFRAFAYRNLVHLYGGVPIVDKPVTSAKADFVRNTKEEVLAFIKTDLEFAKTYLPVTQAAQGRVVRAAADHYLAETNLALKDYDGAIAAATRVIDGTDGTYSLVNARFGARSSETDKDYYYDLFVMGNQNRQTGNNEGIFIAQFAQGSTGASIPGGTTFAGRPLIERMMWCNYWGLAKIGYPGVAQDSTGRGVAYVRGTNYTNYTIWKNSGNDMRNNETNIKRKYYFGANVGAFKKGDLIPKSFLTTRDDTMIYVFPNWAKFGTDKHINKVPDNGYVRNFYVVRLPETYFLRAEAYLGKSRADLAADDINVVRRRANATPVAAANVDMDYILDERARELYGEEFRMLTLARLGKIYDRTKRFGYEKSQASVQQMNNLMPIPQTAIDRNTEAKMPNNPGY